METKHIKLSKFLSLVLRHNPAKIGLSLDPQGWATVDDLLTAARRNGVALNAATLQLIVADNDKQRFAFSEDGLRIRASQGHSIEVDLALEPIAPPELLYHGTAARFIESIRQSGLEHRARQHVHLSLDEATAVKVGQRHGKPVVLIVQAGAMAAAGFSFYRSANGVWLTDHVPAAYLRFPDD
jgi:putative RNA 2'-phosphotransferase